MRLAAQLLCCRAETSTGTHHTQPLAPTLRKSPGRGGTWQDQGCLGLLSGQMAVSPVASGPREKGNGCHGQSLGPPRPGSLSSPPLASPWASSAGFEQNLLVPQLRYVQPVFFRVIDRLFKVKGKPKGRRETFKEEEDDTWVIEKCISKGLERPQNRQHKNGNI